MNRVYKEEHLWDEDSLHISPLFFELRHVFLKGTNPGFLIIVIPESMLQYLCSKIIIGK